MDECEVCGKRSKELYLVDIEGAQMVVCKSDSMGKAVLQTYGEAAENLPKPRLGTGVVEDQFEIVENYGAIIKAAMDSLGIPTKVLAEKINEKESTLIRVEKGHMLPGDKLAKKLEHALGIKLVLKKGADEKSYSASKLNALTMGDAAIIKDARSKGN